MSALPEYVPVTITCGNCGFSFRTRSTGGDRTIVACSKCHPYWTGQGNNRKTSTRIDRFNAKYGRKS